MRCIIQVNKIMIYLVNGGVCASTCGVLCLLYFQNFAEFTSWTSLSSRASLSLWASRESSLFTPSREQVCMRTYLDSLSSAVTLLENMETRAWAKMLIAVIITAPLQWPEWTLKL